MEAMQIIGVIAIIIVAYRVIYLPYTSRKKKEKNLMDKKNEILSYWHKGMGDLFQPYISTSNAKDEDGNDVQTKGWVKLFNRVLYFSNDSELNEFRVKAYTLFNNLESNPQSKKQVESIYKEYGEYSEKQYNEKAALPAILYIPMMRLAANFRKKYQKQGITAVAGTRPLTMLPVLFMKPWKQYRGEIRRLFIPTA